MRFLLKILFHILSNAVAILVAARLVSGFIFTGDYIKLVLAALILTGINMFLKPILKLFLGPFIILSLGLFTIVINALMLRLLDTISPELTIEGIMPLLSATIIIGIINFVLNIAEKAIKKNE